jgi:2-dehydro-3-deoxygluconokinase
MSFRTSVCLAALALAGCATENAAPPVTAAEAPPPAINTGPALTPEGAREFVTAAEKDLGDLSLIGAQWRGATNADMISWCAALYDIKADTFHTAAMRKDIPILDRTGGGDSFASGVLAALLKGQDLDTAVNWGAAHGILVQETPGDITLIDEKAVIAEVKRAQAGGGVKASR